MDKVCGKTKGGRVRHNETWRWNDVVNDVVKEKRKTWKQLKLGGKKKEYQLAKKAASRAVYDAKRQAQSEYFWDINTNNDRDRMFKRAREIKDTTKDVTREKCVRDDKGNITISDEAKLHAWKKHYQRLLNVKFPWNKNSLKSSAAVEGPAIFVTEDIVIEAIKKIKQEKVGGPSGVMVEMIKAGWRETVTAISGLVNLIIYEENIPEDWKDSLIINCYKGKGDASDRGNYRGLKLLEHVMKVLQRVPESLIRSQVDINNMLFGFILGAVLQMQYTFSDKCRRNTLLRRRKSTSLLLT